jgi:hypothetical protein
MFWVRENFKRRVSQVESDRGSEIYPMRGRQVLRSGGGSPGIFVKGAVGKKARGAAAPQQQAG